jgi:hypothetical protein
MNTNQNIIITSLSQAINWASTSMWEDAIGLYEKEDILKNIETARNRIETALRELAEYETIIMNK